MSYPAKTSYTMLFPTLADASAVMDDFNANSERIREDGRTEGFRLIRTDAEIFVTKVGLLYHEKRVVSIKSRDLWLNPTIFLNPDESEKATEADRDTAAAILHDLEFLTTQPGAEDALTLYGHSSLDPYSIVGWNPVNKTFMDKLRSFVATRQG